MNRAEKPLNHPNAQQTAVRYRHASYLKVRDAIVKHGNKKLKQGEAEVAQGEINQTQPVTALCLLCGEEKVV